MSENNCKNGAEAQGEMSVFNAMGKRIGIFVIAYNAEAHIRKTLERIPSAIMDAVTVVYVIDDCSLDETVDEAIQCQAQYPKLVVIRNRVNRRYGGNQKTGYQYAIDQELDLVVMLHADGQYAPEQLPQILQPLVENRADAVLGSRMLEHGRAIKGGMPKYKYAGNRVLTWIQNRVTGMRLSEFHSGYRAYSVSQLALIPFWANSDEWHFDTQILLQIQQTGGVILEVPIPTYYGDEICHVNGMLYAVNCVWTSVFYHFSRRGILYNRKYDIADSGAKYTEKLSDPYSSHSQLTAWLERRLLEGTRVLELGVGDATIVKWLHAHGCCVDAVEIDEASADLARPYCRQVVVDDLDDIQRLPLAAEYDYVIAADVLEHLRYPEKVLSHLKRLLKRNGHLLVSLPNIANIYVRLNLLIGRFPQHSKGILDRTHLHCYTLKSARRLLQRTGWVVHEESVTSIPIGIVFPFLRGRLRPLFRWQHHLTRFFKGLLAYQSLYYCENPNKSDLL